MSLGSLTSLREFCEPLRRGVRAEFGGLFVPLTGLRNIGHDADGAELLDGERVKCSSKHQCGTRAAGLGGAPQEKPRRGDIATLEKICAAINERGYLLGIEARGRAAWLCRRRLRSGDRRSFGWSACHL
jgi:hypothetical protein